MAWLANFGVGVGSGLAVALLIAVAGRLLQLRLTTADARWFGSQPGDHWLLLLPRFYGDDRAVSVLLLEATAEIVRLAESLRCFVTPKANDAVQQLGAATEFTIGGAVEGSRRATHVKTWLPEVGFRPFTGRDDPESVALWIGSDEYRYERGVREYAILGRFIASPDLKPVFFIAGQASRPEIAAARYLRENHRQLRRRFGDRSFALLLENKDSRNYGSSVVVEVREIVPKDPVVAAGESK